MEKRINIAELLKDCPQGMELDCALWDDVKFDEVEMGDSYPICIKVGEEYEHLTEFGHWDLNENAKCVIFPKGKTTWEGFVPPRKFKVGDIVVNASNKDSNAFIYAGENDKYYECYVGLVTGTNPELSTDKSVAWVSKKSGIRPATEEEKEALLKAIKDNGYKWNAETKTLEKLVEPKFDITTLKPFEKVLVRDYAGRKWLIEFFSHIQDKDCMFVCNTAAWRQCVPYEGNEHLLNTTQNCEDFYVTWRIEV